MKSQFILFLFLIISNVCYSQKINLNDLKYIYEHHIESVDTYLIKKGFDFHERDNSMKRCSSNRYKGANQTYIQKTCDEPNSGYSWYQFYDSNIYNSIREECKKNGYKFLRTRNSEIEGSSLQYDYTNGKIKITFSSAFEQDITQYFIVYREIFAHEL